MGYIDNVSTYINKNKPTCINSFALWIGRKIFKANIIPETVDLFFKEFITGAICYPIVFLGVIMIRPFVRHTFVETKWPSEEVIKEIATFSLPRRIAAPFSIVVVMSVMVPVLEEVCVKGLQDTFLKRGVTHVLIKMNMPNAVAFWKSKQGQCIQAVITAAVFILSHSIQHGLTYSLMVVPLGSLLQILRERHGINAAIGLHCTNNFIAITSILPSLARLYFS